MEFIRPKEAARRLGIARSTLYLWADRGYIPRPRRIGVRVSVWDAAELEAAVRRMATGGEVQHG